MYIAGILFAFGALFGWTFGDWFIQRATREIGSLRSLVYIGSFGAIVLLPFVWKDLPLLRESSNIWLLAVASVIVFFAALFDFEALKRGKIAIVQPVIGLELPLTVGLGFLLQGERLTTTELASMVLVFFGILFAVSTGRVRRTDGTSSLERGAILAGVGALGLALTNVIVGVSSREMSPLLTIWSIHAVVAVYGIVYLSVTRNLGRIVEDLRRVPGLVFVTSALDNVAWVCFAYATTFIPIGVATTVSESYVVLDVFLGVFVNRERIRRRQAIGIALAVLGLYLLATVRPG